MFLPKGMAKYRSMEMKFVRFERFLSSLTHDLFTGYCEFEAEGRSVVLLLERGKIVRTFSLQNGTAHLLSRKAALDECKTAPGEVNGVELPSEVVDAMIRVLFCEPLNRGITAPFHEFKNLLIDLEENKFSGIVEISSGEGTHYLFMEKGGPRFSLYFSGNDLLQGAEALEKIFGDIVVEKAKVSTYSSVQVPLADTFIKLSNELLKAFSELKGPVLTPQLWKKLSICAEIFEEVGVSDMEYDLTDLPRDLRRQEEILVSLLECQKKVYNDELGERTTHNLFLKLMENVDSPVKELFEIVV